MINILKAKLRAWLIDLVREAIRIERTAAIRATMPNKNDALEYMFYPERYAVKTASKPVTATNNVPQPLTPFGDKTFEQLQAESIAAQKEFYEPREA